MKLSKLFLFYFISGVIIFITKNYGDGSYFHEHIWIMFYFFVCTSYLSLNLIDKGLENNEEKFIPFYLGSVVVRLILCLIFLGTFGFLGIKNIQLFAINFFVLYLCVLSFEIFENISNLRRF